MNNMSYKIFDSMLKKNDVKAADVSKETGINPTVFTDWKKGKSSPKVDKLQKIAIYFDISIDYLLNGKEIPPAEGEGIGADILDEVDFAFVGDFKELTEERKEMLRSMARQLRQAQESEKGKR